MSDEAVGPAGGGMCGSGLLHPMLGLGSGEAVCAHFGWCDGPYCTAGVAPCCVGFQVGRVYSLTLCTCQNNVHVNGKTRAGHCTTK